MTNNEKEMECTKELEQLRRHNKILIKRDKRRAKEYMRVMNIYRTFEEKRAKRRNFALYEWRESFLVASKTLVALHNIHNRLLRTFLPFKFIRLSLQFFKVDNNLKYYLAQVNRWERIYGQYKKKYELDWQNDSCCFYREKL